jgi:hypothetical protein
MGYGVMLLDKWISFVDNREVVLTGKLVHGMPCVVLDDLWRLPCLTSEASILSDGIDIDELEL